MALGAVLDFRDDHFLFNRVFDIDQNTLFMSLWLNVRKIGAATVSDFSSGDFLDSSRLEVFARHRVLCRARVTIFFGGLLGLDLAGLRWRDAGIRAGLFGKIFGETGNQDSQQKAIRNATQGSTFLLRSSLAWFYKQAFR